MPADLPDHLVRSGPDVAQPELFGAGRRYWDQDQPRLAFTIGTDFRPAKRISRDQVLRWNQW
jgi:hypothetical protein